MGSFAGRCITSGYHNFIAGCNAAQALCSGYNNFYAGNNVARCVTTGYYNVAIGRHAAGYVAASTGNYNVAFGDRALCNLTSGGHNVAMGMAAGACATTAGYNILMGYGAGYAFGGYETGDDNVFIGRHSGSMNWTTGSHNVGIGRCVFQNMGTGSYNVAFGVYALGRTNLSGNNNIAMGRDAGGCVLAGYGNIFLGACAGYTGSSTGGRNGNKNVAIGYGVTVPDGEGDQQLVIGIGNTTWLRGDSSFNIYDKDGNQLNGASGGGGDKFNTTITNSVQATIYGYETDVITLPSDDTKRYTIESISVGNVTAGVGSTVNVIASINPGDTTYSSENKVYIAYNIPVPDNGLVELNKQPIVMNPDDVLKVWATNENNYGINDALELYASYAAHESTDFVAGYGSTVSVATTALTTVYTSSSNPTVLQSIKLTNRSDAGDFPVTIQLVNGSSVTHLAKNLVIPRYASVELLDRPKRLETDGTVKMQTITAANTIDVVVSGKKIT